MGVEGVRHRRHHDAGNEDDYAERHGAAVARHLGATGGRGQLNLVDVGNARGHDDGGVLYELIPAQLLGRDRCRDFHGAPGNPATASAVGVIRHGNLTCEKEVGHLDTDVSQSQSS